MLFPGYCATCARSCWMGSTRLYVMESDTSSIVSRRSTVVQPSISQSVAALPVNVSLYVLLPTLQSLAILTSIEPLR